MAKKYFSGFTFIEVMVAIAIIALLIVLTINTYVSQIAKGNDAKRKADLERIKVAVEEYEKDHNCYPAANKMQSCGSDQSIAIHPYLSDVPCDPLTHQFYAYEPDPGSPSCPSWFRIYTTLQNTKDSSLISKIGPGGAYNYYRSSENAPVPVQSCGHDYWGCEGGGCNSISWKLDCSGPVCQPGFDNNSCNGECGTPSHPLSECIPQ